MSFSPNRRRGACSRWMSIVGFSLFSLATRFLVLGCSPYPVYNQSSASNPNPGQTATVTDPGRGDVVSEVVANGTAGDGADVPASIVEPAIFRRVVEDYLGVPYRLGGEDHEGIDCSRLVRNLFREYDGTRVPASTSRLFQLPHAVPPDALTMGDLVFFSFNGTTASHVGIYLGDGRFVHASESRGVIISSLRDPTYRDRYAGARRIM